MLATRRARTASFLLAKIDEAKLEVPVTEGILRKMAENKPKP